MKSKPTTLLILFLNATAIWPRTLAAQGTAFTYQGSLQSSGAPASGWYDLTFTVFAASNGVSIVGGPLTNIATGVSNGLFTVGLDFGSAPFNGSPRWLEIGVRTNGNGAFSTLSPRQQLTPTPYALFATTASNFSGTITSAQLGGTYSNPVTFNNGADVFDGSFYGLFFGSSFIGGNFIGSGNGLSDVWHTGGNVGTSPSVHYIGTMDNQPLVVRVNGQIAERFLPTTTNDAPNLIGGAYGNSVDNGASGAVIAGGGTTNFLGQGSWNRISAPFSSIGGGSGNWIQPGADHTVIAGGWNNLTGTNDWESVIGGGQQNQVGGVYDVIGGGLGNQVGTEYAVISGGFYNANNGDSSFIGGGGYHFVSTNGIYGVVGGGYANIMDAYLGTIGGGWGNTAHSYANTIGGGLFNTLEGATEYSTIGGGYANTIQTNNDYAFIGGGEFNWIQTNAWGAVIAGGYQNTIKAGSGFSVIAGGVNNIVDIGSGYSAIGGGQNNRIQTNNSYAVIGGGWLNNIQAAADQSVIAGGNANAIQTSARESFVGGGFANSIQSGGYNSFIGGGGLNTNASAISTIVGGNNNSIQINSFNSFIGGGVQNVVQNNSYYATIAGGAGNNLQSGSVGAAIGGGEQNIIQTNCNFAVLAGGNINKIGPNAYQSFVGGGVNDIIQTNAYQSVIAGGNDNQVLTGAYLGAIGGGTHNRIGGAGGTVPGGNGNGAFGINSFAAGTDAQATNDGSFVLTDLQYVNYYSTSNNQLSARFRGGVVFATGGAGMTLDGQPVLAGVVPSADLSGTYANALTLSNPGNSFTGDGSGLTGLNASQLTTGTVPLAQLPAAVVTNNENGVTLSGAFSGTVSGNGSGLTNVNAATLGGLALGSVITNNQSGVTLAGAFSGNGGGLTNLNAATLGGVGSSNFWSTTGNAGTTPGINFIGTTDNQRLLIRGSFVGVGRTSPIGSEYFGVEAPVNAANFGGMYVNTTNATALPFYGYALARGIAAYHYVDGTDANKWKLFVGATNAITVTTAGGVGINTISPDAYLTVNGTADKPGGGSWASFSDARLKKNIEPLTGALDHLLELRPVTFEYKDPQAIHELPGVQIGMIAQEVEKVFPDWVDTAPNGMKRLSFHGFEALTVAALRELRAEKDARIAELEKTNAEMRKELEAQKQNTARLEARFDALEKWVKP